MAPWSQGPSLAGPTDPRLTDFGPEGEVDDEPRVYLRFDRAMREPPAGTAPLLRLEPAVAGRLRWIDPYQLVFDPEQPLDGGHRYTVVAKGELTSTDGKTLAIDRRWDLEVARTEAELQFITDEGGTHYASSGEMPVGHWKTRALIHIDRPTTLDAVQEHVTARGRARGKTKGPSRALPHRIRRLTTRERERWSYDDEEDEDEDVHFIVEPRDHWPPDTVVEVEIDAGLRAVDDDLGTGHSVVARLQTPPGVTVEHSCAIEYNDGCDPGPIYLKFDSRISKRQLRRVRVSPRPKKLSITLDENWGEDEDIVIINGQFEPGRRYTVELAPGLLDTHGQPLHRPFRAEVDFVLPVPELSLSRSVGFLPATEPATIGVEGRWIARAQLRVAVLEDEALLALLGQPPLREAPFPSGQAGSGATIITRELKLSPSGRFGWSSVAVDLRDFVGAQSGAVFIELSPLSLHPSAAGRGMPKKTRGLYQVTDLGALALTSSANATARVARLSTGAPVSDATVQLFHVDEHAPPSAIGTPSQTDARGLATLPTRAKVPTGSALMLVRSADGRDRFVSWLRRTAQLYASVGKGYRPGEVPLNTVMTERPIYQPGEKIRVVGWVAVQTPHTASGLRTAPARSTVDVTLIDDDDEVVDRRVVRLEEYGKYWATLSTPSKTPLGSYRIEATIAGTTASAGVRLRQFRTPPFSVTLASDAGDYLHGATPTLNARASYYFGGEVPIRTARSRQVCSTVDYRPPDFSYDWTKGYRTTEDDDSYDYDSRRFKPRELSPDAEHRGRLSYSLDLSSLDASLTYRCSSAVAIQDAAAAEIGADAQFLVHPSRYLMVESPPWRVDTGSSVTSRVRVVDYQGKRLPPTPIAFEFHRTVEVEDARGRFVDTRMVVKRCSVKTTTSEDDARCTAARLKPGHYELIAKTTDAQPRLIAHASFRVDKRRRRNKGKPEPLSLELSNPKPAPGETLTITVRSTDPDSPGILVLSNGALRTVEPFTLERGVHTHTVEVTDAWIPGRRIEAVLVRPTTTKREALVERANASVEVDAEGRRLSVEVRTPQTASPRDPLPIDITLSDAQGNPSAGHVALWAVDEAILSLEEPRIPDLVQRFVVRDRSDVGLHHDYQQRLHSYAVRPDPYDFGYTISLGNLGTTGYGAGGGGSSGGLGLGLHAPAVRRLLESTPIFLGDVAVDSTGQAHVEGTLPDNLTTFRVTAIASTALTGGDANIGRFGRGEARVRVTAPLVVQAALPRHLRPGDTAQIAALVDNLGGPAGTLTVTATADDPNGAIRLTSTTTATVPVEAGGQVRVPFEVRANHPGSPSITLTATLAPDQGEAQLGDALQTIIPVEGERSLVRQVAVYGSLADDAPVAIALMPPKDLQPNTGAGDETGGVDVALSSTLLGSVEDMVGGLVAYPYGCVEQTASRLLPLAALGPLAHQYPLGIDDFDDFVDAGISRLRSMQVESGGLAYWPNGDRSHAYATAYATWVLQLLEDAGYSVPERFIAQLRHYLGRKVEHWASHGTPTPEDNIRLAMALVTLASASGLPEEPTQTLYERRKRLPLFARALLLMALHAGDPRDPRVAALAEQLLDGLDEREGFAHVRDTGGWRGAFFDSRSRTEAMVLLALLRAVPDDRRVQKLTRGLLDLHRGGGLRNTQERAYALLALAAYAQRYEAEVPDFETNVWVDADFVGRDRFAGRTAKGQAITVSLPWDQALADVPSASPTSTGEHRVTLARTGQGRMYYRVALRWTPDPDTIEPHSAGLSIEHQLRTETGPVGEHDTIDYGQLVALDLVLTTNDAMTYVAVDIPLPAGLEAVDTTIGSGRQAMILPGTRGYWVSHSELRTERVLVFADRLSPGIHKHTVYLRAITPGRYRMPPSRAEAMYYPEVQGNTESTIVEIH